MAGGLLSVSVLPVFLIIGVTVNLSDSQKFIKLLSQDLTVSLIRRINSPCRARLWPIFFKSVYKSGYRRKNVAANEERLWQTEKFEETKILSKLVPLANWAAFDLPVLVLSAFFGEYILLIMSDHHAAQHQKSVMI